MVMSIMIEVTDMPISYIKLCIFWHFEVYQPAFLLKVWVRAYLHLVQNCFF